jgi:hypothetical protein
VGETEVSCAQERFSPEQQLLIVFLVAGLGPRHIFESCTKRKFGRGAVEDERCDDSEGITDRGVLMWSSRQDLLLHRFEHAPQLCPLLAQFHLLSLLAVRLRNKN